MTFVQSISGHGAGGETIHDQEAAKFLERAVDLLELAESIKSEHHRKLLIDSAAKFERMAMQGLDADPAQ